ncbi:MAG: glycosyltransferase [Fidelibacterota bacterium]|nr:MAG: glycosyltransferase [Candidatus Neomarinimicrobiota bacterium]
MVNRAPQLKSHFGYRKFKNLPYRFLFLKYDYFLQDSLIGELKRRDHQVATLPLPKNTPAGEALRTVLTKAVEVRPDAVISINAMGLDSQGRIISILSDLNVPVVIWYLDNHLFNGPYFKEQSPDWAIAFTYERALEPGLRNAGFQHVFYLPLATDPALIPAHEDARFSFLRNRISFVGGTFTPAVDTYFQAEFEVVYDQWNPDFGTVKQASGRLDLEALFAPFQDHFSASEDFYRFMAYVIARETRRYRIDRLSKINNQALVVFGPEEWHQFLPGLDVRSPVDYRHETPSVYHQSAVNLSFTTLQQETALNQRYYDVPLCGGFLLGEWQEALADQFDLDTEVVTFRTDDELRDKASYYLSHPTDRESFIQRARDRVLKEHLMEHRVENMLDAVRSVCHESG